MKKVGALVLVLTLTLATLQPAAADPATSMDQAGADLPPVLVKSLTDYPGRVREVTNTQKAEIRAVLSQLDGNTKFICTGARLEGQPQRMNIVVRLRAKLVCEYAKSLRPDLSYWYQTKVTEHRNFNGRVIVVSK